MIKGSFVAHASGVIDVPSGTRDWAVRLFVGNGLMGHADGGDKLGCYSPLEDKSRGTTWSTYLLEGKFLLMPSK